MFTSRFLCLYFALVPLTFSQTEFACDRGQAIDLGIVLHWPDLPAEGSVAALRSTDLELALENESGSDQIIILEALYRARGTSASMSLGTQSLGLRQSGATNIDLGQLGADIQSMSFSGSMLVRAAIHGADGSYRGRVYAPELFFHGDGAQGAVVYDQTALRRDFNGGDLSGRYSGEADPDRAGIGMAGPGWFTTPDPTGNNKLKLCFEWLARTVDSGYGEDYFVDEWTLPALGARVVISHDNWQEPVDTWLSRNQGCIELEVEETDGFHVQVYANAKLGQSGNFTLRGYPGKDNVNMPIYELIANPGTNIGKFTYIVGWEQMAVSEMMGLATHSFERVDTQTFPRYSGTHTLDLHGQVLNDGICAGGCANMDNIWLQDGRTNEKFGMAHEMGHVIHKLHLDKNDLGVWGSYEFDGGGFNCAYDGVGEHAMRSMEYSANAFFEGFAHFIAALSWNNHNQQDGIFKYYKDLSAYPAYNDMTATHNLVDMDGGDVVDKLGGQDNWVNTMCNPIPGFGTEVDWLRFWWNFRTDPATEWEPATSHREIFDLIVAVDTFHPWPQATQTYQGFADTLTDENLNFDHLIWRFWFKTLDHGIAN